MNYLVGLTTLTLVLAGCAPTKYDMQKRFANEIASCVGKSQSRFATTGECVGRRNPTSSTVGTDGARVLVYEDFWGSYGIRREACRVTLNLTSGDVVTSSTFQGSGCYMPY